MAETSLWSYIKEGMRGRWDDGMRHECMLNKGVSDVSYYLFGNGWIELKEVKKLPVRPTTGVKLGRWADLSQRHFLIKRHGWLLIRINYPHRCYLLFNYKNLPPDTKPLWTWDQLRHECFYIWHGRIDFEILECYLGDHL